MPEQKFETIILELVAAKSGANPAVLTSQTKLGGKGLGLDSIATLELLLAIEDTTGLILRSEALTSETLATVGGLVRFIETLGNE